MLGYVTDFLLLATCFHFSFYFLNLMAFVIPQQNYSFPFLVSFKPLVHIENADLCKTWSE